MKKKKRNASNLLYVLLPLEVTGSLIVCFHRKMGADYFLSLNVGSSKELADKARGVFHR